MFQLFCSHLHAYSSFGSQQLDSTLHNAFLFLVDFSFSFRLMQIVSLKAVVSNEGVAKND